MMQLWPFKMSIVMVSMVSLLNACSGGSEGTGEKPVKTGVSGVVEAPGGSLAFANPGPLQPVIDFIFGKSADAAIDGVSPVGAGVHVNLISIDANGNQVGDVISSADTKADGSYFIETKDFQAGTQYVIRALANNERMDARITNSTVNVNPVSDAASQLIATKINDLAELNLLEVEEIVASVESISKNVDPSGLSARSLSSAMQTEAENDSESSNIINSTASHGLICGKVQSSSGRPLSNIRIIARDYGNWVTRAVSRTISDGSYCINVPIAGDTDPDTGMLFNGQYILGAINYNDDANDPERSASGWWTNAGIGDSQFVAEKVLVENDAVVEKNFNLSLGGRISGKVSAQAFGSALEGVTVVIRDFTSLAPIASARSSITGEFKVNLKAGSYFVEARNTTLQAYASEVYDGASGSNNMNFAIPVVVTNGQNKTANFSLGTGYQLSGTISDGIGGTPVTGRRVMVNLSSGGGSIRLRSNKVGQYMAWLMSGNYDVYAYGQGQSVSLVNAAVTVIADFQSDTVSTIKARVVHNNNIPVSQAKVRIYDSNTAYVNQEPSSSDGSVSIYTNGTGNFLIETRIDVAANYASNIYDNQTRLLSGNYINVPTLSSNLDIGDINLPDAGILSGKVTGTGGAAAANIKVSVWSGSSNADRFITVRSRGDGSYVVSLPVGSYGRVNFDNALVNSLDGCNSINIVAGQTTTLNYDRTTSTCTQ